MGFWSAFGSVASGASDLVSSLTGGWINQSSSKSMTKWNLLHAPTYQRQGLERAGFNPILALTEGKLGSGNVSSAPLPESSNPIATALQFKQAIADVKTAEKTNEQLDKQNEVLDNEITKSQNEAIESNLDARAKSLDVGGRLEALTGVRPFLTEAALGTIDNDHSARHAYDAYIESIRNGVLSQNYLSDPTRVKTLDALHELEDAVSVGIDAYTKGASSAYEASRNSRENAKESRAKARFQWQKNFR